MEVSRFEEKLNKIDGNNYVIEEKALLCEGVYNGELKHDNINPATLAVFTGPRLTGDRIQTYSVSTPSLTPWKRVIKVFADVPEVYISYETDGDTVEAEDINRLQGAVSKTQTAVNSETERAGRAEEKLKEELDAEAERAKDSEAETAGRLLEESGRARLAERELRDGLDTEIKRAGGEEEDLKKKLLAETERAENAEQVLRTGLAEETARAEAAESDNAANLAAELKRSESAEKKLADDLEAEILRASGEEAKLQTGIQNEISRAGAAEAAIRDAISSKEPNWNDKYTRNEVDNKFAALETAIDWKEAVDTYAALKAVYPAPEDGWTVNVKDTDYTYRWSGTEWIAISANAIPKATQNVDGLLSREDKSAYDEAYGKRHVHTNQSALDSLTDSLMANWTDAYGKRHEHANKAVLDKVTQTLTDNWNAAFTHTGSKSNPHGVTKAQAGLGNVPNVATNDQTPTFTQGTALENITSGEKLTAMLGKISKAVSDLITHKADSVSHVTAAERTIWNDADNKKHTHGNKGVIDKLTQAMLDKLAGIAPGADVNVQADWNTTDTSSDAYIKNKPVSMPASDVPAWAKAALKPAYGWSEITGKPGSYPPSSHTHTKSQVTDMPTKLSQFTNDSGFLTSADIDTSKNHTHANKTVLDKVTQALFDNWNTAFTHSGNKSNPHGVTASQVGAAASSHTHPKNQITDFPSSMPASDVPAWAKAASKPSYGWTEISGKPGAFTPAAHSHTSLEATNITGQTVDVNSYNLSSGSPQIQFYSEKTSGGAANITNIPVAGQPFLLKAESLRWASETDYVTKQTFFSASAKAVYERYCSNGIWSAWLPVGRFNAAPVSGRVLVSDGTAGGIKSSAYTIAASVPSGAKFTDTVYAHPNSGAAAGTYRSVTVNAQGHVTAGMNPTTLAGYGITDAAPKSHNHDGAYMPMGPFSWAQMHGAYTWNQLKGV
ncbi:pyocin knob domain-containing protein [Clostridium transplantifaecale]|uniref:pyocin knob domain-containing protein n=1 Tax=Clostridium transplantifaecale TaxID=2479838 RepID=UPI000F6325E8|nr:pyocin knob domain-containing protein [Clostridium transplantifaecale]